MNETMGNLALQDDSRVEIIGGKVVMFAAPSAAHEYVTENIHGIFHDFLRGKPCKVFHSTMSVNLEDGEEYQPDVKVVCDRSKIKADGIHGAPDLVVEVLSPSTSRYDRFQKMPVYERNGVREYWIVDPLNKTIEQYILEDGRFALRNLYAKLTQRELTRMSEACRAEVVTEFRCSLFDDLTISVDDVFADLEDW